MIIFFPSNGFENILGAVAGVYYYSLFVGNSPVDMQS
jgi:hypothetical protein